jgi:hypothetical protein
MPPDPLTVLGQSSCSACELPLHSCWQFRDDDRYCSLCSQEILHLLIGPGYLLDNGRLRWSHAPAPGDDKRLWLYWPPDGDLLLCATWGRGVKGRIRGKVLPPIDGERSEACFRGQVGLLRFEWQPVQTEERVREAVARLVPPEPPQVPANGLPGWVRLVCSPMSFEHPALLLPWPAPACVCADEGLADAHGVLHINQRNARVPLELRLQVKAPVWVLGCTLDSAAGGDRVELHGFGKPTVLEPGKHHSFAEPTYLRSEKALAFRLFVDSSRWQPRQQVELGLSFRLHSLPPLEFRRKLTLLQGSRLTFLDGNVKNPEKVQLGQVFRIPFVLTVGNEAGGAVDTIEIIDYQVKATPAEGDWLKVEYPPRGTSLVLASGKPDQLLLQIDTRRLDRSRFENQTLEGEVRLIDSKQRRWACYVQTVAHRPPELGYAVAFDWGTTNSCAAYDDGGGPRPLALHEKQRDDPEKFPSDVYFEDVVSDPKNPVIRIGPDAEAAALFRPECHVRSVKRKFQFRKQLPVIDEQGHRQVYSLREVVQFLLQRLVAEAERVQGVEISTLSLTFPTKWPPRVRGELREVALALQEQLRRERPPRGPAPRADAEVRVEPPEIDEANAVAIHLLTCGWTEGKEELRDKFYLIAYDFGGGTVDTCVLEVTREEGAEVRTRYIGIGGREDFGGDEVTRAVMMLLHQRLTQALKKLTLAIEEGGRSVPSQLQEIPMVPDGMSLEDTGRDAALRHHWGRKNWETLWRIAEHTKVGLSGGKDRGADLVGRLSAEGDSIWCRLTPREGPRVETTVTLEAVLNTPGVSLDEVAGDINFTLEDAWTHPLDDLDGSNGGQRFTVEQRLEDTIAELKWQCARAGIGPQVIVLAGGGCRLPLIQQRMREAFPLKSPDYLIFAPEFSKQRVAFGLASYLDIKQAGDFGSRLARSVDVIHHALGVRERRDEGSLRVKFWPIVPAGTLIDSPTWHPFSFAPGQLRRNRGGRSLVLWIQVWQGNGAPREAGAGQGSAASEGKVLEVGSFDLTRPGERLAEDEECLAEPLPEGGAWRYDAELRLRGAGQIEIRVTVEGRRYGPYRLAAKATEGDLEDLLQGPAKRTSGGLS